MKNNLVIVLILIVLLAAASVMTVSASPPTLAVTKAPAGITASSEELLCNLSRMATPELPGSKPAVNVATQICGVCSVYLCKDRNVGVYCYDGLHGFAGWCLPPNGDTDICSVDGRPSCQCVGGYN
jgi:hypothetical protein